MLLLLLVLVVAMDVAVASRLSLRREMLCYCSGEVGENVPMQVFD